MSKRRVIIELKYNKGLAEYDAFSMSEEHGELDKSVVPRIPGVKLDESFAPVSLPGSRPSSETGAPYRSGVKLDLALDSEGMPDPKQSTYIVRGEIDEKKIEEIKGSDSVAGVYADVEIAPIIICPGSPPLGTDTDVEQLLCASKLHNIRMDGSGVMLAIVDTGINLKHLVSRGKNITIDSERSWVPRQGMIPGQAPVDHGTMCAYDASILAPNATFLDIQLLRSSANTLAGLLSDAVRAYRHLCTQMITSIRIGQSRSMVVSNSWGMFHPSWDLPVGDPGNYSDNPNHPFNKIVGVLEHLGADILFAAGNCGADCPDGRCGGITDNTIYGANGHPSVLTVAGVDVTKTRVGYSSQGPGRLSQFKPDVCGYTHFAGSGVYAADGGTSAATPVVAGLVAAVRSKRPFVRGNPAASPATIRGFMRTTAEDLGTAGFDYDHGYGVVNGCEIYRRFETRIERTICDVYPWLCKPPVDLCRRFPFLCKQYTDPPFPPIPSKLPFERTVVNPSGVESKCCCDEAYIGEVLKAVYQSGYEEGQQQRENK